MYDWCDPMSLPACPTCPSGRRWKLASSRYGHQLIRGLLTAVDRGVLEPTRVLRALNIGTGDMAKLHAAGLE